MPYQLYQTPPRVLIVDDFINNIQVLVNMLQPHNYDIEYTTNGAEALDLAWAEPFDLILLDVLMPDMDGFEVCKRLKNNVKTKNVPIIFVTAKTDEDSIQQAFQAGAVDYIIKPYQETELVERVKTHVTLERQRKALVATNQAKNRLFSIIGQDLKSPMHHIYSVLKEMKENYPSLSEENKQQCIKDLFESAKQNLTLLEELLEWSRTQTNTKPYKPIDFDIDKAIVETLATVKEIADKKEIKIRKSIEYKASVYGDINMIKTVIKNLLTNAIKFSYIDATVEIKVTDTNDQKVSVAVIDYGVGISNENQEKLFQIDQHISTTGTQNEKGTGLGLILCKEFIDKHNEKLYVESTLNQGAIFSFTINKAANKRKNLP